MSSNFHKSFTKVSLHKRESSNGKFQGGSTKIWAGPTGKVGARAGEGRPAGCDCGCVRGGCESGSAAHCRAAEGGGVLGLLVGERDARLHLEREVGVRVVIEEAV